MKSALQSWISLVFLKLIAVAAQQVPDEEMNALSAFHNSTSGNTWLWQDEHAAGAVWNFPFDGAVLAQSLQQLSSLEPDVAGSDVLSDASCVFFPDVSRYQD